MLEMIIIGVVMVTLIVVLTLTGLVIGGNKVREWRSDCNCIQCREMRIMESK